MTAPNPQKQKSARNALDKVFFDSENTWVIHYSCESFYDRVDGKSPRITSIALRHLHSGQTISFSIHQMAERLGMDFAQIEEHYDDLERKMLDDFYAHVGSHRGMKYVHWNMRDINFGFAALEHRYRVLGGAPVVIEDEKKIDLARLFVDIYGVAYSGHPRLEKLLKMNSIKPRDFMTGKQEADAFEKRNFVGLHQSTLRKVDILSSLAERAHDRHLMTNTTWWQMHGGKLRTAVHWTAENKELVFVTTVVGLAASIYGLWPLIANTK